MDERLASMSPDELRSHAQPRLPHAERPRPGDRRVRSAVSLWLEGKVGVPRPSPCSCGCSSPPSAAPTEPCPLDDQQQAARDWFESLRDRICAAFEEIEREAGSDAAFHFTPWDRTDPSGEPGGGGVRGQMAGQGVREGRGQRLDRRRPVLARIREEHPGRRGRPELLRDRNQPRRAHGQPARPRRPHEHPLPDHDEALVRRRRRPQPCHSRTKRTPRPSTPACAPPARRTTRPSTRAFPNGRRNISGFPTATSRAAWAASSTIIWKAISTPISLSPATSARRSSTSSRRSSATAWTCRSPTRTWSGCSSSAGATSSSTCSMTAAHSSGSRPAATSMPS